MTNPTKVLFLDIDGVLNSTRSVIAFKGFPHGFDAPNMAKFDHAAIGMIRKLCEETDASIVLSSSWRILHTVHDCANGLDLPIFDKTPGGGGNRGKQIEEWLDAHPEVTDYAIVDDDGDMLFTQYPRFVKTNCNEGLTYKDYLALKGILGGVLQ
jgi:hypothetical protein